jgi:hypothetical protein
VYIFSAHDDAREHDAWLPRRRGSGQGRTTRRHDGTQPHGHDDDDGDDGNGISLGMINTHTPTIGRTVSQASVNVGAWNYTAQS